MRCTKPNQSPDRSDATVAPSLLLRLKSQPARQTDKSQRNRINLNGPPEPKPPTHATHSSKTPSTSSSYISRTPHSRSGPRVLQPRYPAPAPSPSQTQAQKSPDHRRYLPTHLPSLFPCVEPTPSRWEMPRSPPDLQSAPLFPWLFVLPCFGPALSVCEGWRCPDFRSSPLVFLDSAPAPRRGEASRSRGLEVPA